jgi:uncharacterized protein (TIGR02147 family)
MHSTESQKLLQKLCQELDILGYFSARRFFSDLYKKAKCSLKKYSYRQFSADLGYGETNFMHLVCTGKRRVSQSTAREVASALGLSPARRRYFLSLVRFENAKTATERSETLEEMAEVIQETLPTRLDKDQFAYFSNWENAVIRELTSRPDFQADPDWIVKRVRPVISIETAKASLATLLRIGYLKKDESSGKFLIESIHVRSPREAKGTALYRFHHHMIEHGRSSMTRIDPWRREIGGSTVRLDDDAVRRIKKEVQDFHERILAIAESCSPEAKQVYQLNTQFFPFTEVEL